LEREKRGRKKNPAKCRPTLGEEKGGGGEKKQSNASPTPNQGEGRQREEKGKKKREGEHGNTVHQQDEENSDSGKVQKRKGRSTAHF